MVRTILPAGAAFLLLVAVTAVAGRAGAGGPIVLASPFAVIAVATILLTRLRGVVLRTAERITRHRAVTPYAALAEAVRHLRSSSLPEALPGLARILAGGTGAHRSAIWLADGDRLAVAASYPIGQVGEPESVASLPTLLSLPGLAHAVPVVDAGVLRAVLTIDKPDSSVTAQDRALMDDVAHGVALLLRTVVLHTELTERVRQADRLVGESRAFRHWLDRAREVERRRLLTELFRATSGRLAALRKHVTAARAALGQDGAGSALRLARTEVDELLERFRVIARGVYPAVLRAHGPFVALEELVADLARPVRLTGDLNERMAWEIESAVYQATAATLAVLASQPATAEIRVRVALGGTRVRISVEDPAPPVTAEQVRTILADDIERLAALGGDIACAGGDGAELRLHAWLPGRSDATAGLLP